MNCIRCGKANNGVCQDCLDFDADNRVLDAINRGNSESSLLAYIRQAYQAGQNPLPGLRKKLAGRWQFNGNGFADAGVNSVIFTENQDPSSVGYGWMVEYTPA